MNGQGMASPRSADRPHRKLSSALTAQERRVVKILRIALLPDDEREGADRTFLALLAGPLRAAFAELAQEARRNRLVLFIPSSAFVSEDELAILSRLILLQRPTRSGSWRLANPFQQALKRCADELGREGRRLPARPALTEAYIDRGGCFRIEILASPAPAAPAASYSAPPPKPKWDGRQEPEAGSLKARALAMVRSQETVSTAQFTAIGISRQYLSLLGKWGYVEKAGHGRYRFPSHLGKKDAEER